MTLSRPKILQSNPPREFSLIQGKQPLRRPPPDLARIYSESNAAARAKVEFELRVMGGLTAVNAANEAMTRPDARNRSVLGWISFIIHLLKKLISVLFPRKPRWLQAVMDFIDEIIEMLQKLLGGREAARMEREMTEDWLRWQRLVNEEEASAMPFAAFG